MSKDVRVLRPPDLPKLDPVIRDITAGFRTKQDESDDLSALDGLTGTGLIVRVGDGTAAVRTLTAPAAGIIVGNGNGVAGNPTLGLSNDLAGLESLGGTGFAVRSASDTWLQRSIAGAVNEITVTNGDGVAGNPTISLPVALTFTGKTVTGGIYATIASVSIDDANFGMDILSNFPTVTFDINDVLRYDRSTNAWAWRIGGADVMTLSSSALAAPGITAEFLQVNDSAFVLDIVSGAPRLQFDTGDLISYNRSANTMLFEIGGSIFFTLTATRAALAAPLRLPSYSVAGVPSASTMGAGTMIYVSNEAGGAVIAFSDGTSWLRVTDRAVIS